MDFPFHPSRNAPVSSFQFPTMILCLPATSGKFNDFWSICYLQVFSGCMSKCTTGEEKGSLVNTLWYALICAVIMLKLNFCLRTQKVQHVPYAWLLVFFMCSNVSFPTDFSKICILKKFFTHYGTFSRFYITSVYYDSCLTFPRNFF